MSDLASLTAAPAEVALGGKTYRISPLRIADYGEFERWVQSKIIRLAEGVEDPKLRDALVVKAMGASFFGPEATASIQSTDGKARLIYLAVRRHHPDVTPELIASAKVAELSAALGTLNRMSADPKDQAPAGAADTAAAAEGATAAPSSAP